MTPYIDQNEDTTCLQITVNRPDANGFWTVTAGWHEAETDRWRASGTLCTYLDLPSVLCELAHEVTGSITLASGGVFG
jgi:hypothetical protein